MYGYLVYLTRDRSLAEDLAADTFEKALRKWRGFDPRTRQRPHVALPDRPHHALDWFRAEERRQRREERAVAPERVNTSFTEGLSPRPGPLAALSAGEREVIAARPARSRRRRSGASARYQPDGGLTRLSRALKKLEEKVSIHV